MQIEPIGVIHTCFKEKFGIPRQSGLAEAATGEIVIHKQFSSPEIIRGLDGFDYIWLIFQFHQIDPKEWSPTARPPRLGGNKRMGLFATRSPYRPNPIGLSNVKLLNVEFIGEQVHIKVSGVDLLDQTPIIDIKPYIVYADSIPEARNGWLDKLHAKEHLPVVFSKEASTVCEQSKLDLALLITQILELDPRPAYSEKNCFANKLLSYDVHWEIQEGQVFVSKIINLQTS